MPAAATQTLIGSTLAGRFRITGFIGEGAMAAVYRGEQDGEPRQVAVKIMHPELLGDATFVGRFRREAKAASRLRHPNTVQLIDYGVEGSLPFIVMELLEGRDLFEILTREHRLSEARAARVLMGVCEALEVAHSHGVVHRDLKPENVMLVQDPRDPAAERVKVLDFGIAKIVDPGAHAPAAAPDDAASPSGPEARSLEEGAPSSMMALTRVGVAVGTPAYMSPEQCRGDAVDGRSDLYACGVMLFLLVTGRLPFAATGAPWEVAAEHLRKAPPAPSSFVPKIHPGLEATILTALAKWPAQRQQSARELREELARILPDLPEWLHTGAPAGPPPDADTIPIATARSRAAASIRAIIEGAAASEPGVKAALPAEPLDLHLGPGSGDPLPSTQPAPRAAAGEAARSADPPRVSLRLPDPPESDPSWEEAPVGTRVIPADLSTRARHPAPEAPGAAPSPAAEPPPPRPATLDRPRVGAQTLRSAPDAPAAHRAPTQRPPPMRPSESLAAKLVVPVALLIGVLLGLVALLLMR